MIAKVYGPPGTGKTSYLIDIVKSEIGRGVHPSEIVYCSFTNAAAKVARDRTIQQFPWYQRYDFKWFSTIHSICFRLLQLLHTNVFSTAHLRKFGEQAGHRFSENFTLNTNFNESLTEMTIQSRADCAEAFVNWCKNRLLFDTYDAYNQFRKRMYELPDGFNLPYCIKYISDRNKYKSDNYLWDFPDMIIACIENVIYPLNMRVLILDEAQDSFPAQFELIKMWSKKAEKVYIAGDAYQAIYTFSGADPNLMIDFESDEVINLKQSHRCPRVISDITIKIINRFKSRYNNDGFIPAPRDGSITRGDFDYIPDKRIFYILRTRFLADIVGHRLVSRGIPFRARRGAHNIFSSDKKIDAVMTVMSLVDDKDVPLSLIVKLLDYIPTRPYLKHGAKTQIRSQGNTDGNCIVSRSKLNSLGFTDFFISSLSDYHSAISMLHMPIEDINYITRLIRNFGSDIIYKRPNLELGTIHSVKGDEADIVVLDPTYTSKPWINLVCSNEDEEHRIMYVAVTRTRDRLILLQPASNKFYPI